MSIGLVAAGPSLGALGVPGTLADPAIDIVNGSGVTIYSFNDITTTTLNNIKVYHSWINSLKEPGVTGLVLAPGTYSVIVRNQNETGAPLGGVSMLSIWEM